ncbi:MAG: hypothetical protein IKS48_02160 [Eubacterium sp.]|nr:hypothetical protein [Eubacterium sp.]
MGCKKTNSIARKVGFLYVLLGSIVEVFALILIIGCVYYNMTDTSYDSGPGLSITLLFATFILIAALIPFFEGILVIRASKDSRKVIPVFILPVLTFFPTVYILNLLYSYRLDFLFKLLVIFLVSNVFIFVLGFTIKNTTDEENTEIIEA